MPLLEIKNLQIAFGSGDELLRAVDGVSFVLNEGETVCLVGESGCGKSVTALSIARLVPTPPAKYVGGEILLNGRDVLKMDKNELRSIRGGVVSYVFQEPSASLNPVFRIGNQIKESLKLHRPIGTPASGTARTNETNTPYQRPALQNYDAEVIRLLKLVGIPAPESRIRNYPFEMSGGMQQRVMIAMALASEPKLLVADEPTTALDVTIQAQILELMQRLCTELNMALILITHDLGVVAGVADRINIMYAGHIVEIAPVDRAFAHPRHPYTLGLLASVPRLDKVRGARLLPIRGTPPDLIDLPQGCPFLPRCPYSVGRCAQENPPLDVVQPLHLAACWVDTATAPRHDPAEAPDESRALEQSGGAP